MDTRTGMILPEDLIPKGQEKYFVPVARDLTRLEELQHQIKLYSPCACGSGKKCKFCCHRKVKKQPPDLTAGEFNRREC